jgi:aryl-alcohol dehydrogenase-like predicted oxidoreductase
LRELREQGKVHAIGITHWSEGSYDQMARYLDQVDVIQVPYNPIQSKAADTILGQASERDIGVIVMRPFGEGSLLRRSPSTDELAPFVEFGVSTWPQVLLKWVLSDPRCHVAIPATTNPRHLLDNLAAGKGPWFGPEERALVSRLATS